MARVNTGSNRFEDNYLACSEYAGHPDVGAAGHEGLVAFRHKSGEYYFAWYDDEGNVLMRSEGYPTAAARDNGLASVARNRDLEERYSIVEKNGKWFAALQAGNYQEIARSCPCDSRIAAEALLPGRRATATLVKSEPAAPVMAEAETLLKKAEALLGSSEGMVMQKLY